MQLLKSYGTQVVFFCCAAIFGMLWDKAAIISIPMIMLVLIALIEVQYPSENNGRFAVQLRPNIVQRLQDKKYWFWIAIPFLLVVLSMPYSEDWDYLIERLRIKLPFLILPFAFAVTPPLKRKELHLIGFAFIGIMLTVAAYVLFNYFNNYEIINLRITQGKPIPTPSNHIRFSLSVAIAVLVSGAFTSHFYNKKNKVLAGVFGLVTLFLVIFIHILSVRSGLLALYAAIGSMTLLWIWKSKKWLLGSTVLLGLIALPFLALQFVPSLQKKAQYAQEDLKGMLSGNTKSYSDGERLISWRAAFQIIKENPIIGVGAGDLKQEMKNKYIEQGNPEMFKRPHCQWISIAVANGIIGVILFAIGFFVPLFSRKNYQVYLLLALHIIFFLSLLPENTFENNYGVSLWLFALLIGLNYVDGQRSQAIPLP